MADQTNIPSEASALVNPAIAAALEVDAPTNASTPASIDPAHDEDIQSKKVHLADLSAKGTTFYAHKKYEDATEVFSRASILQAEVNGETAPENAEILFHYGRSLFKVGQSKSDVLGASAPKTEKKPKPANGKKAAKTEQQKVAQDKAGEGLKAEEKTPASGANAKSHLFQFTGDENLDESDEDEEADGEGEEDEEEDDDMATAFEILDLARVCYEKHLAEIAAELPEDKGKGKEEDKAEDSPTVRHIKERLADTHDALSEISLESERYPNAIEDGRTSLKYKMELYPEESEIIAEAHFKLSLSLEFNSITTAAEDGTTTERKDIDHDMRNDAAKEMELAIKSSKLKLQKTEVEMLEHANPEDNAVQKTQIAEMKEVIKDMEDRLAELKSDPIDTKGLLGGDANPMSGILGAAIGESAVDAQARIDEATKNATNINGLVRKKPKKEPTAPVADANGKRKAEDEPEDEAAKRAKTEEPAAA